MTKFQFITRFESIPTWNGWPEADNVNKWLSSSKLIHNIDFIYTYRGGARPVAMSWPDGVAFAKEEDLIYYKLRFE